MFISRARRWNMKLITHLIVFALGCGIGIWYGVNRPSQAQNIAAQEQKAVAEAKIKVIEELHPELTGGGPVPPGDEKYEAALQKSQQELDAANKQLNGQP